ncbi:hypothetical protein RintRC_1515 [Richelia intracellularis]|nr:hypothetical protein RintRC_1515 [Richelia intracellularis]
MGSQLELEQFLISTQVSRLSQKMNSFNLFGLSINVHYLQLNSKTGLGWIP